MSDNLKRKQSEDKENCLNSSVGILKNASGNLCQFNDKNSKNIDGAILA